VKYLFADVMIWREFTLDCLFYSSVYTTSFRLISGKLLTKRHNVLLWMPFCTKCSKLANNYVTKVCVT